MFDLVRAWLLALCLPTCSFGVLPVAWLLRRMGIRWAVIAVVALATPLIVPWTLGYLLDQVGVTVVAALLVTQFALALAAGLAIERCSPREESQRFVVSLDVPGQSTLMQVLSLSGRTLNRSVLITIGIGLVGVGWVALMIPPNAVGDWLVERSAIHATFITLIPLFTYAPPQQLAMQAGEVVHSSSMPYAIVPLILLGGSVHLGSLAVASRQIGLKRVLIAVAAMLFVTVAAGVMFDVALLDRTYRPEDSHAFEDLGRPFHLLGHPDGALAGFVHRFERPISSAAYGGAAGVAGLIALGRLTRRHSFKQSNPLRTRSLSIAAAAYAAVCIGLATYTYFPPPAIVATQARAAAAEIDQAIVQQDEPLLRRQLDQLDELLRRLALGAPLHGRWLSGAERDQIAQLRSTVALWRHPQRSPSPEERIHFQMLVRDLTHRVRGV